MRRLGSCLLSDGEERPSRALDDRGLPQQEAVQAEANVARGALLLACRAIHLLRHVIEHALARLACGRTLLFTRLGAEILAVEIADGVGQGPPHDCRERSALRGRPLQLPAN